MAKLLNIGTRMFAVGKTWVDQNAQDAGAKVIVCRVKTYQNVGGVVTPVLQEIGGKTCVTNINHYIYDTLAKAVDAISSTTKTKSIRKKK